MDEKKENLLLSKEETNLLILAAKSGDEKAFKKLINSNRPFIYQIARRYLGYGVELEDLVQEGKCGLIKAIEKFDVTKDNALMTFAFYYIQKEIINAINTYGRRIKITKAGYLKLKEFNVVKEKLFEKLGRYPSISEIAKEMHISYNYAFSLFIYANGTFSLDYEYEIKENSNMPTLKDFLIGEELNPDKRVILNELRNEIKDYFKECQLSENEIIVIMLRFGFINNRIFKLKQISPLLQLTVERTRQIEADALRKMRSNVDATKAFLPYMRYKDLCLQNIDRYNEAYKDKRNKHKSLS